MKLNALSSTEALLEKVDVLCVPSSKERAAFLYEDVLARIIHADALPPLSELLAIKSIPSFFFGHWKGHRIKVVFWCEGEKMTEASAYSLAKKMAIKVRTDCPGTTGLVVHHLDSISATRGNESCQYTGQSSIACISWCMGVKECSAIWLFSRHT